MIFVARTIGQIYDGRECRWCQRAMNWQVFDLRPTRDHYPVPRSKGGTRTVICCWKCNNVKGDMTESEWAEFRRNNPRWWEQTTVDRATKRKAKREAERTDKWGPRGARVIRQPEKPTSAIGDQLAALGLAGRIARDFDRIFPGPVEAGDDAAE